MAREPELLIGARRDAGPCEDCVSSVRRDNDNDDARSKMCLYKTASHYLAPTAE
jgi:hypothetical protein